MAGAAWLSATTALPPLLAAAALAATGHPAPAAAAVAMLGAGEAPRWLRAAVGGGAALAAFATPHPLLGIAVIVMLGARRRLLLPAAAVAGAAAFASVGALAAAAVGASSLDQGVRHVRAGVAAAQRGDAAAAQQALDEAAARFAQARRQTRSPWAQPALAVPVVGRNMLALKAVAEAGDDVADSAARLAQAVAPDTLTLDAGSAPVAQIEALQQPAADTAAALRRATARLHDADSPWLVALADRRMAQLRTRLVTAQDQADSLEAIGRIAPAMLGADGPRRYFLAVQTPSELRGSGGFIGNFGEITADAGRLSLGRLGRTSDLNLGGDPAARHIDDFADADFLARYSRFDPVRYWQNVTASPHFPYDGKVIAGLYPQSGGAPVDGVIAVDPFGLAALLKVVGPVTVPDWPEPITYETAPRVLLFEQYRLAKPARIDFLETVTFEVWQRLLSGGRDLADVARAVAPAITGKHLMAYSVRADEQDDLVALGAAGAMPPDRHLLAVVNQNAGGNKIDWFLRRHIEVDIDGDRATVRVVLSNEAPAAGLPRDVIGNVAGLPNGTNKTYLSVYTDWGMDAAALDGRPLSMESEREAGYNVYSAFVAIPPQGQAVVELELQTPRDFHNTRCCGNRDGGRGGTLELFRQATAWPDEVAITVDGRQLPVVTLDRDRRVSLGRE